MLMLSSWLGVVMTMAPGGGARDFDFLIGKTWNVKNRVLQERLTGSDNWTEFDSVLEDVRSIAGGWGNVDSFKAERDGETFEGNSLRLFDPQTGNWTIYWLDSRNRALREQVVGRFQNGVGELYGEELFRGRMVKMRFLWSDITETSARWEQAYQDANGDWETNWVMEFSARP